MATTATARLTLGALLGAVTTTARTFSNSLNAINDGVEMLNTSISAARERQETEGDADFADFEAKYRLEAGKRIQEAKDELEDWLDSRPGRRENFAQTMKDLDEAITARRLKREQARTIRT